MTWKTFTDAIKDSELTKDSTPTNIVNLFIAAGRMEGFTEQAAAHWVSGRRNCKVSTYFPGGKITNKVETFNFFRKRPEGKLKNLQLEFRKINDNDSPIDLETTDMDIFCCSLVNQFADLLGLPRVDITEFLPNKEMVKSNQTSDNEKTTAVEDKATEPEPDTSENSEKKGMPHNEALPESMLSVFYRNSIGFAIDDFINSPVYSITPARIRDMITFIGCIKTKHENEDNPDKSEETYKKIIEFTDTLYKYIVLLKMNSVNPVFPECFELANDNDDGFKEKAKSYLKKLKGLYPKIIAEYENEEDEKMDKKRAEHKKIFENIEPGALDELSDSIFS